jgi:hypothetical protein
MLIQYIRGSKCHRNKVMQGVVKTKWYLLGRNDVRIWLEGKKTGEKKVVNNPKRVMTNELLLFEWMFLDYHTQKKRMDVPGDNMIWHIFLILDFNTSKKTAGYYLSAKGVRHQWEGTWTWPPWYNEELWRPCCILLPSTTYRIGSKVRNTDKILPFPISCSSSNSFIIA